MESKNVETKECQQHKELGLNEVPRDPQVRKVQRLLG